MHHDPPKRAQEARVLSRFLLPRRPSLRPVDAWCSCGGEWVGSTMPAHTSAPLVRKPLGGRHAAPSLSRNSYRTQTLSRRCPRALWFGMRILPLGEWTASRASYGGPIQLGCLGTVSPPSNTIITGQELSEPSACYQLHRDWCKADPRSLRGLLVSSFSAWQRMSSCPDHEQPAYRVCFVCRSVSPSPRVPLRFPLFMRPLNY